jgi:hypothetical protein
VEGTRLDIGDVEAGEQIEATIKIQLSTDYVMVAQSSQSYSGTHSYTYYGKKTYEDDLKGFWIRVYGPSIDGKPAIREWCYPSDTCDDFEWPDTTSTRRRAGETAGIQRVDEYGIGPNSLAKSDPEKALQLMEKKYVTDPAPVLAKNIGYTYVWFLKPRKVEMGLNWLKKSAGEDNESACILLAGIYSTYYPGFASYLDVEQTVKYANQAQSLGDEGHLPHEMMASAYAQAGRFDKAVEHQQIAVRLFKNEFKHDNSQVMRSKLDKMEGKLSLYHNSRVK